MNIQTIEKRVQREDGMLDVFEIFPTIQGEGPHAGCPSVFVRTAGCNLQCNLCDTDYTSKRELWTPQALLREIRRHHHRLVVITGGEPLRQGIGRAVRMLLNEFYRVQIETNGTVWDPTLKECVLDERLKIVCSPKTAKISPLMEPWVDCWKYIMSAGKVDSEDGLPLDSLGCGGRPARPVALDPDVIYVQPCDDQDPERNAANTQAAVASCLQFGYRLCLQLHKLVGLP